MKELTLNPPTENSKGLRIGNFVQIRDVVDEELESVWSGKKDAKAALDEAVKRGNELLKQVRSRQQVGRSDLDLRRICGGGPAGGRRGT